MFFARQSNVRRHKLSYTSFSAEYITLLQVSSLSGMWQQCRSEVPRCEKCAEGHETKEYVTLGKVVMCINCRGAHGAGDQECPVRERQVEGSRDRVVQRLSYAEAVKKVEQDLVKGEGSERSGVSSRSVPVQRDGPTSDICFSKIGLLAFIVMVINCTAGMERKSQKIEFVVAAAERYVCVRDTGCVKWLCPILSGCWPEVGLHAFK